MSSNPFVRVTWAVLPVVIALGFALLPKRFRVDTPLIKEQTWGCGAVSFAMGTVFSVNLLLISFHAIEHITSGSLLALMLFSFFPTLTYAAPVSFVVLFRERKSLRSLGIARDRTISLIAAAVAAYFMFVFLWAARRYLQGTGWDSLYRNEQFGDLLSVTPIGYALLYTALVVVSGSVDEVVFRGFALLPLARVITPSGAVISTALFWSMAHFVDPDRTLRFFFEGLLYGWMFYRMGSLFPTLTFHALSNVGAVSDFVFGRLAKAGIRWTNLEHFLYIGMGSFAVVVVASLISLYWRPRRRPLLV
jgi:membrane protease YdiL (CAAX protease family)